MTAFDFLTKRLRFNKDTVDDAGDVVKKAANRANVPTSRAGAIRGKDMLDSLAEGGVLIYETFAAGNESVGKPSRPDFLLQPGELLRASEGLQVVAYEDGFCDRPERFVQRMAAVRKRPQTPPSPPRYPLDAAG